MFACIFEGKVQLTPCILLHSSRYTNATRERQRLQPRCDVYAIAINVIFFDDNVAHVDTHAKLNPFILKYVGIARAHTAFNFDSATHCIDNTAEFHQHAVAGVLNDPSTVFGDFRFDDARRWSFNWTCVPSSSQPMSRLYPATSAARMAHSRRSNRSWPKANLRRSGRYFTPRIAVAKGACSSETIGLGVIRRGGTTFLQTKIRRATGRAGSILTLRNNYCDQPAAARGARLRELRWKNSAWLATAETIAGWNGFEIRNAGSGRSPVRKRSG